MTHNAIAQLFGIVAVVIALGTYQFNNRKIMLRLNMVAALFYTISFLMLGALTGAAMNALNSVRSYSFSVIMPTRKNRWVLVLFLAASAALTAISWQGPDSLFAMGGAMLGAVAFWQKNPLVIRTLALVVPPLWFIYDMRVGSYPGMFIEIFNVISILVGKYRFDFRKLSFQTAK